MSPVVTQTPLVAAAHVPEEMVIGPSPTLSANVPRRWWVWAVPVIAGGLALAIVIPLTLGGASDKTTSTSQADAGGRELTGTYVGQGDTLAFLLRLAQSGTSLTGTLSVGSTAIVSGTRTAQMTGTVDFATNVLTGRVPSWGWSFTGKTAGTSMTLSLGKVLYPSVPNKLSVVFERGTVSEFLSLTLGDRAAQSNLTNALTEAKALYQVTQSYAATNGRPYGVSTFTMQAPEFTWTTGSCSAITANCISFLVMDVSADHDAQGLALAVYSSASSTCWYAIDIEATPVVIPDDASALKPTAHGANGAVIAGVFYAKSLAGSSPTSCNASLVLHAHHAAWASSYSTAGGLS
jgi:hypothetical protein